MLTPPIWMGYSPHHLPFGGTITIGLETMLSLVEDVASSALENGFDAVLFVNGHGGNKSIVSDLVSEIGLEHPTVDIHGVTYFTLAGSFIDDVRESDPGGMGHGGEFETSLMLYLRPELVHSDAMEGTTRESKYTHGSGDMFDGGNQSSYSPFSEYSESGAIGDPTLATAENGEEIYERLGDEMATLIREIHESATEREEIS
jgi:creatinine amidohydrolase